MHKKRLAVFIACWYLSSFISSIYAADLPSYFPDWSEVGYQGKGVKTPENGTTIDLEKDYNIKGNGKDYTKKIQKVIDSLRDGSLKINGKKLSEDNRAILQLPKGKIVISKEIRMDASFVTLKGMGKDPKNGTSIIFRPAEPGYTNENGRPEFDRKFWPGFASFRVEDRDKASGEERAGSINYHWKSGVKVDDGGGGKIGDTKIKLASNTGKKFKKNDNILVGAANELAFYEMMDAQKKSYKRLHMRTQMFTVKSVDKDVITLDKPLEFDLPFSDDGKIKEKDSSEGGGGGPYYSKITPLKDVKGVGFEDFYLTHDLSKTKYKDLNKKPYDEKNNPKGVTYNYSNPAPEYAYHGILFKFATDSWVKNVEISMTGSHPIVTEFARHMVFADNVIDGAWNKGKGGNGYFRGSKLYDSLITKNKIDRVRHLTLQWSATGNVVYDNDMTVDMNFHGGWERRNLVEKNTIKIPAEHYSWGEGEGGNESKKSDGNWFPLWYGAGFHASKWSGSTGELNVLYNNKMSKQKEKDGPYVDYKPYNNLSLLYLIGWDGEKWAPLKKGNSPIQYWSENEEVDFSSGENSGVQCLKYSGSSVYKQDGSTSKVSSCSE